MYNKNELDKQAEKESKALQKQGREVKDERLRFEMSYLKSLELRIFGNILRG